MTMRGCQEEGEEGGEEEEEEEDDDDDSISGYILNLIKREYKGHCMNT